jgi:hypothetical protein
MSPPSSFAKRRHDPRASRSTDPTVGRSGLRPSYAIEPEPQRRSLVVSQAVPRGAPRHEAPNLTRQTAVQAATASGGIAPELQPYQVSAPGFKLTLRMSLAKS